MACVLSMNERVRFLYTLHASAQRNVAIRIVLMQQIMPYGDINSQISGGEYLVLDVRRNEAVRDSLDAVCSLHCCSN